MENTAILLDIQQQVGALAAIVAEVKVTGENTNKKATITNGRVNALELAMIKSEKAMLEFKLNKYESCPNKEKVKENNEYVTTRKSVKARRRKLATTIGTVILALGSFASIVFGIIKLITN